MCPKFVEKDIVKININMFLDWASLGRAVHPSWRRQSECCWTTDRRTMDHLKIMKDREAFLTKHQTKLREVIFPITIEANLSITLNTHISAVVEGFRSFKNLKSFNKVFEVALIVNRIVKFDNKYKEECTQHSTHLIWFLFLLQFTFCWLFLSTIFFQLSGKKDTKY